MGIPCHIKYKSSLGYKTVYNYVMCYFIRLIMTSLKALENLKNKQINF